MIENFDIALQVAFGLCLTSSILWFYASILLYKASQGHIKLSEDSCHDLSLDRDIPLHNAQNGWERRIFWSKITCSVFNLATLFSWVFQLQHHPSLTRALQVASWAALQVVVVMWISQSKPAHHWKLTAAISAVYLLALAERLIAATVTWTRSSVKDATTVATLAGPAFALAVSASIPKAPQVRVDSPFIPEENSKHGITYMDSANLWSIVMFNWTNEVVASIFRQMSSNDDETSVPYPAASERAFNIFLDWKASCARSLHGERPQNARESAFGRTPKWMSPTLWRIFRTHQTRILVGILLDIVMAASRYLPAYATKFFLRELEEVEKGKSRRFAIGWLAVMLGALVFRSLATAASMFLWNRLGPVRIRSQLGSLVFEKALNHREASSSASEKPRGNILTLFSTDATRAADVPRYLVDMSISKPIELIAGTWFLWTTLHLAGIVGLAVPVALIPLTRFLVRQLNKAQKELMRATDRRVAVTNEVLLAIKHTKIMAHEEAYAAKIASTREAELQCMKRFQHLDCSVSSVAALGSVFTLFTSLLIYTKIQHRGLDSAIAFSSIMVSEQLRKTIDSLSSCISTVIQGVTSLGRIEMFLSQDGLPVDSHITSSSRHDQGASINTHAKHQGAVSMKSAVLRWSATQGSAIAGSAFQLGPLDVDFEPGLNLVCGGIGSGKSLLLLGLLGEIPLVMGTASIPSSAPDLLLPVAAEHTEIPPAGWLTDACAYVPQTAWLLNGSVKANILFGLPLDIDRYGSVVYACGLLADLAIWPDGDKTEIGERGVILSGGQKARLSLARAIYSRASCILLDDVLSAVDAHTAQHIFKECLCGNLVASRTVVLVTHAVHLCASAANKVLHLEHGRAVFSGCGQAYVSSYHYKQGSSIDTIDEALDQSSGSTLNTPASSVSNVSSTTDESSYKQSGDGEYNTSHLAKKNQLIQRELKGTGFSSMNNWFYWARRNGGILFWTTVFVAYIGNKGAWVIRDASIGRWTDALAHSNDQDAINNTYLGYLLLISLAVMPVNGVRYPLVCWGSRRFSREVYREMLRSVMNAPLRFFDTTLLGSLYNRFGRDFEVADTELANLAGYIATALCGIALVMMSILVAAPAFLVPLVILSLGYTYWGRLYIIASREMRRMEAVSRSPIYSLYAEVLSGSAVIRAFGGLNRFMMMQMTHSTKLQAFVYSMWSINRWAAVRFEISSISLVALIGATALVMGPQQVSAGFAGFLITVATRGYQEAMYLMRFVTQGEIAILSVERIREYCSLPKEAPAVTDLRPPESWPAIGQIAVRNLSVQYAPELPMVLKKLSFNCHAGEKVAVVGSTGSGKSTLSLALFRLIEPAEGSIVIDNIDVSKIGLQDLRSRMTIVTQDPTILSGTLREALDPLDEGHSDQVLYSALRTVHLLAEDDGAASLDATADGRQAFSNLDFQISEHGKNLSAGERQLLCLARAILKRHKIVVLDEATSSVDYETDKKITQTIRDEFDGITLLVIAHRLRTIINYDKVLVMSAGELVEIGKPADLILDSHSKFHALCQAAGAREFQTLQSMCMSLGKEQHV